VLTLVRPDALGGRRDVSIDDLLELGLGRAGGDLRLGIEIGEG
jgi:hypothetical protein